MLSTGDDALSSEDDEGSANTSALQEAHQWVDEHQDDEVEPMGILSIIASLVKMAKKCKTPQAVKSLMPLTALTHFIKLRARYKSNPNCHRPALAASLTAARCMGKGPYFARKIRKLEPYILRHHALPPSKTHAHNQLYCLLDNEGILQGVREYLAALKLGEVTPLLFMKHINSFILPSLGIHGIKSTISESTARRWLLKLGYRNREAKKGLYVDGHERPDVSSHEWSF
jgi:hypothetical protein